MDPLRLCLALGPLAIYVAVIGAINFLHRPWVVSGGRDLAALALGISGLMIVGPIELFFPYAAASEFGLTIWPMLLFLYALGFSFVIMISRPRLVVYNTTAETLRAAAVEAASQFDPDARWIGNALMLRSLGVQFTLDSSRRLRSASLIATSRRQDPRSWRRFEEALAARLRALNVPRNPAGMSMLVGALFTVALLASVVAQQPQRMADELRDLLRLAPAAQADSH